ncbi:unnamed protein product [Oikopleura dioica]|uniref:VWFA domain-containing protein n=1 Tax=Oikopleura dioica TaxID=34765 RepID=E4XG73_OIKDI|nr:unnamed protein product [Oikopleura dioica]
MVVAADDQFFSISKTRRDVKNNFGENQRARLDSPTGSESTNRIKISICGQVFVTQEKTLARAKNTRLYRMITDKSLTDGYDATLDVYYFDRHLPSFPAILYFYQTGFIWRPLDVPMEVFVEEVIFYGLSDRILAPLGDESQNKRVLFCMGGKRTLCVRSREAIWNIFEKPETSLLAKAINVLSIFFILISTISFCLETIPHFQENNCYTGKNNNSLQYKDYHPASKTFPFWVIETICITFFTIEYILRYWSAPDRCRFVPEFMNLVDLAAIVPYYITIIFDATMEKPMTTENGQFLMILRVIRLARIVRIAKLSRHSRNLSTLIKTMKTSLRELSFLMLFFIVSMVLFATFVYFCEVADNPNMFPSIPASFWWAIVTMTTVGYGDTYPITALGKVVGFLCTICGVLCIALPVPSIVSNFHRLYQVSILQSSLYLTINGFELIQKHTLLFSIGTRLPAQAPDGTAGSIFQFPRDPFQKVYAVKATYLGDNDIGCEVLYDIATKEDMTAARIELEDNGDKFQYFFGKCPNLCLKIKVEFVLGTIMQRSSAEEEKYESRIPMHVGRTRYVDGSNKYWHAHKLIEDVRIHLLYADRDNLEVYGFINDDELQIGLKAENEQLGQFRVTMGDIPTINQKGQYSTFLDIKVNLDIRERDSAKKKYAERPLIHGLPNRLGNVLSFDISPALIKEKMNISDEDMAVDEKRTPREITFLLDRSGTMAGQPISDAVSGILTLLNVQEFLRENDTYRILSFGQNSEYLWINGKDTFGVDDFGAVRYHMQNFQATMGEKNLKIPVEIALNRRSPDSNRVFILITDGLFDKPRRNQQFQAQELKEIKNMIANEVDARNTRKFRFFSVGVGRNASQMGCDELARAGKGSFIYVPLRHRLQNEMMRLTDHILHNHYELTDVRLVDRTTGDELRRFTGPGIKPTAEVWKSQWECLGLPTQNLAYIADGRTDAREALERHQILSIYNNERIHLHIASNITPKMIKNNVQVYIEIDHQPHRRIGIDISEARLPSDEERRARGEDLFPLQSYAYQQSAFFSMMDNIPEIAKLHTEFACKTGILAFKKTSFGIFEEGIRAMEIHDISAHDYEQYFNAARGGNGNRGVYAGGTGSQNANFGRPPQAGGASAMRKHQKQNKYGVRYQNKILPKPTFIREDKNFNPLHLQADRDWIWKSKQQTWEQLRKYLGFEENIHLPMLYDYVRNFRFSASESEATQQRDDVLVTIIVYAIFEKQCDAKRDIWSRSWEETVKTMKAKFGATEDDIKKLKLDINKFIKKKGLLLPSSSF